MVAQQMIIGGFIHLTTSVNNKRFAVPKTAVFYFSDEGPHRIVKYLDWQQPEHACEVRTSNTYDDIARQLET